MPLQLACAINFAGHFSSRLDAAQSAQLICREIPKLRRNAGEAGILSDVAEIKKAVIGLTESQYGELMDWLIEYDWANWDQQIEADSKSGKLKDLELRAAEAKRRGQLTDL